MYPDAQGSPPRSAAPRRDRLEVQIHPANIQRGVFYLFLSRTHLALIVGGLLVYLAVLLHGLWIAPSVIRARMSHQSYRGMVETRERLGDRLRAQRARLTGLKETGDALALRMNKIFLAYGVDIDDATSQAGYPAKPIEGPEDWAGSIFASEIKGTALLEAEVRQQAQILGKFVEEIQLFESEHRDQVLSTPSTSPLRSETFVLTSPYGSRNNPFTKGYEFHAGIDLAATSGTPVYATADGLVTFAGRYSPRQNVRWWRFGNVVAIRNGGRFVTLFGHLNDIKVRSGQRLKQGDLIGTVGNTGWSTNPHLHYEVRRLDQENSFRPIDPRIYIHDHRWRDEEQLLARARKAPEEGTYEALPRRIRR